MCTVISVLTTLVVEATIVWCGAFPHAGFDSLFAIMLTAATVSVGFIVNFFAGSGAASRGEYGGWTAAVIGMGLWAVTVMSFFAYSQLHGSQIDLSQTWGEHGVADFAVEPDRKIVILGTGLARLLPDGELDSSFHRDYSMDHGGSLAGPRIAWPQNSCAETTPTGDLLLAIDGQVFRVLPDGRDGPAFSAGRAPQCFGVAQQADGKVVSGWARNGTAGQFSRNLADGRTDPSFHPDVAPDLGSGRIAIQDDGKILLAGWVEKVESDCFMPLVRLNPNGSRDPDFGFGKECQPKDDASSGSERVAILGDGSILVSQVRRRGRVVQELAHVDRNSNDISKSKLRDALQGLKSISSITPVSNGRILALADGRLVRLLADGTTDATLRTRFTG